MKVILNEKTNPYYNLAFEEYVMTHLEPGEKCVILWQNEPTIVVGKHQNTVEEINEQFVKEKGINVVRRMSGGGAVYHDGGNLNYTVIHHQGDREQAPFDFASFTRPVVDLLKRLGVPAAFNSRNDLDIEGKKFSGNAQYVKGPIILHHGTLLFDSELEVMVRALNVSDDKIISKGIKSVRSRVTNISEHLPVPMTMAEFKHQLAKALSEGEAETAFEHTEALEAEVCKLRDSKYATWDWNYGTSPDFNVQKRRKFDFGLVDVRLAVESGVIRQCKIYGDFFGKSQIEALEAQLTDIPYDGPAVDEALSHLNVGDYVAGADRALLSALIV
ncbi:MAG: lipoate---protein ligase [Clostridiales bacterium]|jgi:lipoate-protein ligase A|nr:lipoate---protein ligase [Clostridiales bacterium]